MPWRRRHDGALGFLGAFGDAVEFIFSPQTTRFTGGRRSAASTRSGI